MLADSRSVEIFRGVGGVEALVGRPSTGSRTDTASSSPPSRPCPVRGDALTLMHSLAVRTARGVVDQATAVQAGALHLGTPWGGPSLTQIVVRSTTPAHRWRGVNDSEENRTDGVYGRSLVAHSAQRNNRGEATVSCHPRR